MEFCKLAIAWNKEFRLCSTDMHHELLSLYFSGKLLWYVLLRMYWGYKCNLLLSESRSGLVGDVSCGLTTRSGFGIEGCGLTLTVLSDIWNTVWDVAVGDVATLDSRSRTVIGSITSARTLWPPSDVFCVSGIWSFTWFTALVVIGKFSLELWMLLAVSAWVFGMNDLELGFNCLVMELSWLLEFMLGSHKLLLSITTGLVVSSFLLIDRFWFGFSWLLLMSYEEELLYSVVAVEIIPEQIIDWKGLAWIGLNNSLVLTLVWEDDITIFSKLIFVLPNISKSNPIIPATSNLRRIRNCIVVMHPRNVIWSGDVSPITCRRSPHGPCAARVGIRACPYVSGDRRYSSSDNKLLMAPVSSRSCTFLSFIFTSICTLPHSGVRRGCFPHPPTSLKSTSGWNSWPGSSWQCVLVVCSCNIQDLLVSVRVGCNFGARLFEVLAHGRQGLVGGWGGCLGSAGPRVCTCRAVPRCTVAASC